MYNIIFKYSLCQIFPLAGDPPVLPSQFISINQEAQDLADFVKNGTGFVKM